MEEIIQGKAFVLGDHIDTDQIIPAEHLVYSLTDLKEAKLYGKYALSGVPVEKSGLPKGNIPFVAPESETSPYTIIIAGKNFGCGSSREHAPFALKKAGVKAVVAASYARIFYRNAVDGGFFLPLESAASLADSSLEDAIKTGDQLTIHVGESLLKNNSTGKRYSLKPLGDVLAIIKAGDVFAYARQQKLTTPGQQRAEA